MMIGILEVRKLRRKIQQLKKQPKTDMKENKRWSVNFEKNGFFLRISKSLSMMESEVKS